MELQEALKGRRSIRAYKDEPISLETIEEIITAATLAPSWKNSQTARYHVVISQEMKNRVITECLPELNQKKVIGAGALVVTTFKKSRAGFDRDGNPDNEVGEGWGFYDLGLHNQNFMLAAYEKGLGTLVMGLRDEPKLREVLEIPEDEIIVAVIALGEPDQNPSQPPRKTAKEIITYK